MALIWNRKRSGGVAVTGPVHALITKGNAARDRREWESAAAFYQQALKLNPSLAHIWIQMGHAHKEEGDLTAADAAYAQAATLKPGTADPLIHRGHVAKMGGTIGAASRHYLAAFKAEPTNAEAATELHRLIARSGGPDRVALVELLRRVVDKPETERAPAETARIALDAFLGRHAQQAGRIKGTGEATRQTSSGLAPAEIDLLHEAASVLARIDDATAQAVAPASSGGPTFVFDVSDLIGYFGHARLPTGIQRVQIEVIGAAIGDGSRDARICCFVEGRDDWLEVPGPVFQRLAQLSVAAGDRKDPFWMQALNELHLDLALSDPFTFPQGASLINLGTSWSLQNYFLRVRDAKERYGIRYIPMVHDVIPVISPEFFVRTLTQDFISWAVGVVAHADAYLANSQATKRDLLAMAATIGTPIDPERVAVIALDADFRKPGVEPTPVRTLDKWGLEPGKFILFVGTVEARKGHAVALDAWAQLIRTHGAAKVPKLVCVGNRGWLNGPVYARLQDDRSVRNGTVMLSHLSDAELALLYRTCLFTIYPSLYEGWGLPVTEALCYGKAVITTTSSSLPEAGGDLALYVAPGSVTELAAAVALLVYDPAALAEREAAIAGYQPRSWSTIASQIDADLLTLADRSPATDYQPPAIRFGAYYPVCRSTTLRIWPGIGSGEIFRSGTGWRWPDKDGCSVGNDEGSIAMTLPSAEPVILYVCIRAGARGAQWQVSVADGRSAIGVLRPNRRQWVRLEHNPGADRVLRATLSGKPDPDTDAIDGEEDRDTLGIEGLYVHAADDTDAALRLMEANLLDRLDEIDAYRPPG